MGTLEKSLFFMVKSAVHLKMKCFIADFNYIYYVRLDTLEQQHTETGNINHTSTVLNMLSMVRLKM